MFRLNLNELAERVAAREGKKKNLTIAQIKEVIKIVLEELANAPFKAVVEILVPRKKK